MTAHIRSGDSWSVIRSWRRIRTLTRLSTCSWVASGRLPVIIAAAYSGVCNRPGTTWGSKTRRLAASVSSPMYTLYGMSPKACHQPCWRDSLAICISDSTIRVSSTP